jgi:hypothetical protein
MRLCVCVCVCVCVYTPVWDTHIATTHLKAVCECSHICLFACVHACEDQQDMRALRWCVLTFRVSRFVCTRPSRWSGRWPGSTSFAFRNGWFLSASRFSVVLSLCACARAFPHLLSVMCTTTSPLLAQELVAPGVVGRNAVAEVQPVSSSDLLRGLTPVRKSTFTGTTFEDSGTL